MLHLRTPLGVHLPHGRQPRPDMALTPAMHLVRCGAQRRHHLLLRANSEMPHPALLAQVPQLSHLQLRLCSALRPRRLRCYRRQLKLQHVEIVCLQRRKRKLLPHRSRRGREAGVDSSTGFPTESVEAFRER